jgi:hypothetical protein
MTAQLPFDGARAAGAPGLEPPSPIGPGATYDGIKAINWSSLKHMAVSPLLYRWRIDHPLESSASQVVGNAIHCMLLEPEKFEARYVLFDGTRRGKAWDEWQEKHPGAVSLKPDELARVTNCVAAIRRHRVANRLVSACRAEEVLTWRDPETGLACKGKLDGISPTYVADLKSARDVRPMKFERASAEYLYHGQVAWYHDGATLAGKIDGKVPPYIIAAQSDEPYDVAVFQLDGETLDVGRGLYRSLLRRLVQCIEADFWPGVAPDLETLTLPPWAIERPLDQLSEEDF